MLTQKKTTKASSPRNRASILYEIKARVRCDWLLPKQVAATFPTNDRYEIMGGMGTEPADVGHWKELPHVALANLRAFSADDRLVDPDAVKTFTKRYGVLCGWMVDEAIGRITVVSKPTTRLVYVAGVPVNVITSETPVQIPGQSDFPRPRFFFDAFEFANAQSLLRTAWKQSEETAAAIEEIEKQAVRGRLMPRLAGMEFDLSVRTGGLGELRVNNLWSFVCLQFLNDYAPGDTAKCAHPDCPAPYFLKKRHDQKFCEAGPCVAWGHRQRSLKYWHKKHGKTMRKK